MTTGVNEPNCEISKDMYVKLISSDGHEFYIKRDLALTSQTIKAMLSGPGLSLDFLFLIKIVFFLGQYAENETNVIHFRSISSQVRGKSIIVKRYNLLFDKKRFSHVFVVILHTKLDIPIHQSKYLNFQLHQKMLWSY
jgi:hypothetical protein